MYQNLKAYSIVYALIFFGGVGIETWGQLPILSFIFFCIRFNGLFLLSLITIYL